MVYNILKIISVFVIGVVGGIFADQILWPYFIERPLFYEYRLEPVPINVTERKEVIIEENKALQEKVEKVEKAVIGIKTRTKQDEILLGSGLIITSDGLAVVFGKIMPKTGESMVFFNNSACSYQVLRRDDEKNLAIIKIERKNLPTVGFADFDGLRKGQRIFLLGKVSEKQGISKIVNQGIIRSFEKDFIITNIIEEKEAQGSPVFNIQGKLVGLSVINSDQKVRLIPSKDIREFGGF